MSFVSEAKEKSRIDSLPSISSSNGPSSHHSDIEKPKDCKCSESVKCFLEYYQTMQDLMICFQKKFKEYESVSEYASCHEIEILKSCKWKELPESNIPSQSSKLLDNLDRFMNSIYDKTRNMDNAVVRLRNEYEKLSDEFKIQKAKLEMRYKTKYSSLDTTDLQTRGSTSERNLKKKLKLYETELFEVKEEYKTDKKQIEEKYRNAVNDNRKLKKMIESLEEKNDGDVCKELKVIQKQIKEIYTKLNKNEEEIPLRNDDLKMVLSNELGTQYNKVFEETKKIRIDIKELKEMRRLDEILKTEEDISGMQVAMENMKNKLQLALERETLYKNEKKAYELKIEELKKENDDLKENDRKKITAIEKMRERINVMNNQIKEFEDFSSTKLLLIQSNMDREKLQVRVNNLGSNLKDKVEECESLKKDKMRLVSEMENMKKLNFQKKTMGK